MMMGMGADPMTLTIQSDPLATFNAAQNSSNNDATATGRDINGNSCEPGWDAGCTPVPSLSNYDQSVHVLFDNTGQPTQFVTPTPASGNSGSIALLAVAGVVAFALFMRHQ